VRPRPAPAPRTPFEERYLALAKRICLTAIPDPRSEIFLFGSRARGHCDHSSDVDIGIAGPLAGFVFILPAALIAHYFAAPAAPVEATEGLVYFESPLLFKFFEWLFSLPEMVELNPVMWAAWVGTLLSSLNLLPVGQLDGGHVTYAVFGARGNRIVGLLSYLAVIGLALVSLRNGNWNWVVWVLILTFMLRAGHPPVLDAEEPIGLPRTLIALIGLIVFILCFMPIPIRM
jgi:membrane-associated protease RseP (regulator of RpoE activity)